MLRSRLACVSVLPLIIVHLESQWEGAIRVANEIAAMKNKTIYFVATNEEWKTEPLLPDLVPDHVVVAPAGEVNQQLPRKAVVAGGYFRACFANVVRCIAEGNDEPVEIHIPMKAVYHTSRRTLYEHYKSNFRTEEEFLEYIGVIAEMQFKMKCDLSIKGDCLLVREKVQDNEIKNVGPNNGGK
jgi:hypothetical protein